jgi:cytidyltransferase-like protein
MLNIFCDGVFDLFHKGHLKHLQKIRNHFDNPIHLIVGVINDELSIAYKRKPIFNEKKRVDILKSCLFVDQVVLMDNLIVDNVFLKKHNIDFVVHSFLNDEDYKKQEKFYEIPIKLNKFIKLEYNHGISTTKIINESKLIWDDIWEKKGNVETNDLFLLNGWENTNFQPKLFIENIFKFLDIKKYDSIIEIGCGSGLLSTYLKNYKYYGLDNSISLVNKHIKLLDNIVLNFNSTESIFKNNYFDYCICNSMLEYLKNEDNLNKTIDQMERITKKGIYIGSIRFKTRTTKQQKHKYNGVFTHFVINKQYFIDRGFTIIENLFENQERFDAYKLF